MIEPYFIINIFWQWVLSGCNNMEAAYNEGIWKVIMAVITSALKYKRVRSISSPHLFEQGMEPMRQIWKRAPQFYKKWYRSLVQLFKIVIKKKKN